FQILMRINHIKNIRNELLQQPPPKFQNVSTPIE
ncbi:MAG: hypothetical protein RL582_1953, partial [Bacteroidota bacterium]